MSREKYVLIKVPMEATDERLVKLATDLRLPLRLVELSDKLGDAYPVKTETTFEPAEGVCEILRDVVSVSVIRVEDVLATHKVDFLAEASFRLAVEPSPTGEELHVVRLSNKIPSEIAMQSIKLPMDIFSMGWWLNVFSKPTLWRALLDRYEFLLSAKKGNGQDNERVNDLLVMEFYESIKSDQEKLEAARRPRELFVLDNLGLVKKLRQAVELTGQPCHLLTHFLFVEAFEPLVEKYKGVDEPDGEECWEVYSNTIRSVVDLISLERAAGVKRHWYLPEMRECCTLTHRFVNEFDTVVTMRKSAPGGLECDVVKFRGYKELPELHISANPDGKKRFVVNFENRNGAILEAIATFSFPVWVSALFKYNAKGEMLIRQRHVEEYVYETFDYGSASYMTLRGLPGLELIELKPYPTWHTEYSYVPFFGDQSPKPTPAPARATN